MTPRNHRTSPAHRAPAVPSHRGPQAIAPVAPAPYGAQAAFHHAPNAALLIDFDNVTMGIRSDLGNELRNLLGSDIIRGKVAVQRAYADWRRYPQYVVPLTESSIDMIFAPAYGTSKKNATDIRLAVDAMELVFTRPEIGTYILLSGDSDFSSLVLKLKEYGKYVIGVGIRESSSDLLVMNCDEYYSYNALAGLVKTSEEEPVKHDPWELVVEAVGRMKRNGDVMRSDRLKQVMQEIDSTFDEKDLGMAKFSRFAQEAAQRGLIRVTRLDNGQMEVDVADGDAVAEPPREQHREQHREIREQHREHREPREQNEARGEERANGDEGRRGRRGRGRGRGRDREGREERGEPRAEERVATPHFAPPLPEPVSAPPAEMAGERLTREEALDLLRRAVAALTTSADVAVPATEVRRMARELLGRDSETLNERFFHRILRDAHDADVIDLRKRGDDYEVAPAAAAEPVAEQLAAVTPPPQPEPSQAARSAANAAALRRGIRGRGRAGGRGGELPPELFTVGVVETTPTPATAATPAAPSAPAAEPESVAAVEGVTEAAPAKRGRRGAKTAGRTRGRKTAAEAPATPAAPAESGEAPARPRRPRGRKKTAAPSGAEG